MGFLSWFKRGSKKDEAEINTLCNLPENATVTAHQHTHTALEHRGSAQKIIMLSTEDHFSNILINYAFGMAKRLDCEVIAINVTDVPRSLPEREKGRAIEMFEEAAKKSAEGLIKMADSEGIEITHLVKIGDPEKIADKLHASCPGIRCVVTEPEKTDTEYGDELIPVYCFTS